MYFPKLFNARLLVSRYVAYTKLETRSARCVNVWKSQGLTRFGKSCGNCSLLRLLAANVGLPLSVWAEIRSLIQSGRDWVMPPGKAFLHRSDQADFLGWKKQSAGVAVVVDCVQSASLVLAFSRVLYPEASKMDPCLLRRLGPSLNGSANSAWTAWCVMVRTLR